MSNFKTFVYLQGGAGNVIDTWKNFHWLLEHHSECAGCSITTEACIVLSENCVTVCVYDLDQKKTCAINTDVHFQTSTKGQVFAAYPGQEQMFYDNYDKY